MVKIEDVKSREILDSRGNPTIETTVILNDGTIGTSSVPAGSSIGKNEAFEMRDGDPRRYGGLGVLKAVSMVNDKIGPKLKGQDATKQQDLDTMMVILDSSENKKNLGANSILSVSQAVAKAASISVRLPLYKYLATYVVGNKTMADIPTPIFNLINGGLHGVGNLDFQEFLLLPASSKKMPESVLSVGNVYHKLRELLIARNANYAVGDEGGFLPSFFTNIDGLVILADSVREAGYQVGFDMFLGLDVAASHLKVDAGYQIKDRPNPFSADELLEYYSAVHKNYNILYLEDPFNEDDFEAFARLTALLSETTYVVGDDLTVTNPKRLEEAIKKRAINSIIIKPNQIGTVTEAIHVALTAKKAGLKVIVSHRSGETTDDFIADFAVGISADYAKFGAPARGERVVKYNRLLKIAELESS